MTTCQYTGIELSSKRAKNCPAVTTVLNEAYKCGKYDQVVAAMIDAKRAGKAGLEVIEIGKLALKNGYQSTIEIETSTSMIDIIEIGY